MKYVYVAIVILIVQIGVIIGMPTVMTKFISKPDRHIIELAIQSILTNDFGVLKRAKAVNPAYETEFRLENQGWNTYLKEKPKGYQLKSRKRTGEHNNLKESVYILKMSKNKTVEMTVVTEISSGEEILEKISFAKPVPLQEQWKVILTDYLTNFAVVSLFVFLWGLWKGRSVGAKK